MQKYYESFNNCLSGGGSSNGGVKHDQLIISSLRFPIALVSLWLACHARLGNSSLFATFVIYGMVEA